MNSREKEGEIYLLGIFPIVELCCLVPQKCDASVKILKFLLIKKIYYILRCALEKLLSIKIYYRHAISKSTYEPGDLSHYHGGPVKELLSKHLKLGKMESFISPF